MNARDAYVERLRAVALRHRASIDADASEHVSQLIDNNEGAEALVLLAWVLSENEEPVAPADQVAIFALASGFVTLAEFPPGWIGEL